MGNKCGKTKVAKYFLITSIAKYILDNPDLDVRVKWFALEESTEEFALSFISTILAVKYGVVLSPTQLKSLGDYTLSKDEEALVDECRVFLNDFLDHVDVIDSITNPYGMWKNIRSFTEGRGKFFYIKRDTHGKEVSREEVDPSNEVYDAVLKKKVHPSYNHYEPKNPKEFVFIVTDHVSLLTPEKKHGTGGQGLHAAMGEWSKKYCLKYMVKLFNYHVINIQQQTAKQNLLLNV